MKEKISQKSWSKKKKIIFSVILILGLFLFLLTISLAGYFYFLNKYENRFYPGVIVNNIDLSGLTYMEAFNIFDAKTTKLKTNGLSISYLDPKSDNQEPTVQVVLPIQPPQTVDGAEQEIYKIDFATALTQAFAIGRAGSSLEQAKIQYWTFRRQKNIDIAYQFNQVAETENLKEVFGKYETPAVNANIAIDDRGEISLVAEISGLKFNYDDIVKQISQQLARLDNTGIEIFLETDYPKLTVAEVQESLALVEEYLNLAPLTLVWEDKSWEFDRAALGSWMSFSSGEFNIDPQKLSTSLVEAKEVINTEVKEARWQVETNEQGDVQNLNERQAAEDGREINMKKTAQAVHNWLLNTYLSAYSEKKPIALVVDITKPKFSPENVAELGIKNLLGTGYSNMAGSPVNRQHNIARGVELLNGLLVAPQEQFCLNKALKPYTIENGYLSELVIAGNETKPEVGGGLCQVGTTSFRAALSSGVNITERQNHSYQVSYYSDPRNGKPGTDATIYDPWPDFCFINDTSAYILMQTRLEGTALYFDYWGTNDGRKASYTEPVTYNWVAPPPTKEIPTPDLAPSQKRCTESAHAGITASFVYHIDYADGTTYEKEYVSVYKPWQAVCQVGEEPKPENKKKN